MESSSNNPKKSQSQNRSSTSGFNPFQMNSPPPRYLPNPMFGQPQLGYQINYNQPPPQSPNFPTQVAYNEFRYQARTPPPFEFEANDIRPDPDTIPLTQSDVETVPETQQASGSLPQQASGSSKGRATNTKWTPDEEVALMKAWIDVSQDNQVGNSQKRKSFWNRVLEYFHKETGHTQRTDHQLCSKWKTVNKQVTAFSGIYNNLWTSRKSGQSDADIKREALVQYREIYLCNFVLDHVWEVAKMFPKWAPIKNPISYGSSKRSKTSDSNTFSDAQTNPIDFNENFTEDENEVEFVEPQRPVGKKKGKRTAKTASSASSGVSSEDFNKLLNDLSGFKSSMDDYTAKIIEQNERKLRLREQKELRKALQYLQTSEEGLQGADLEFVRRTKEEIRQKYGIN